MTTRRKKFLLTIAFGFISALVYLGWQIAKLPEIMRDSYGQWVTAELVINFHREMRRLPLNWLELEPIFGTGEGLHHGGLKFSHIKQRIVVDFARLRELENAARSTSGVTNLPKVITTRSGLKSHWQGAEPNQMIYDYLHNPPS